jgi:16S rRNA (cytidine1402-2'-O)-methyltransferase
VVATPIGNLEDVTLRALRILREVNLVAAEDTRRTARLLQHYSISTRTTSLHEHNEWARTPAIIARLQAGESVALVSDAGTPVISDPGRQLVASAHAAGIRVEPIPGPNAAIAAMSASGIGSGEFFFAGFPPPRSASRKKWLASLASMPHAIIIYEAPHRVRQTLEDISAVLGDRTIAVARELTKAHEELVVRPISMHLEMLGPQLGEYTLVISPNTEVVKGTKPLPDEVALWREFCHMTEIGGLQRKEALRELGLRYGTKTREVYAAIVRQRNLAKRQN